MSSQFISSSADRSRDAAHPRDDGAPKAHSSFRMHASSPAQRARMKRWIEAKHRRQEIDDDDSLMSIVTTGDDEPKPMDPDDAAYRGRVPSRSRIGTIQSYREAQMSPKTTRNQDRSPPPGPAPNEPQEGASVHGIAGAGRTPRKGVKSYPVVYSSDDDPEPDARTTCSKRRRKERQGRKEGGEDGATAGSKRIRMDEARFRSPHPLDSEEELPSVWNIVSGRRSPSPMKSSYSRPEGDSIQRRLFRRDEALPCKESLFDDEAEEVDDQDRPVQSRDEMPLDPNEYDYEDPFIDDSPFDVSDNASDSSMHSAYSRKARRRRSGRQDRKASSRLQAPVKPTLRERKSARRAKPFPFTQEVVEISSGSEYEDVKVPRSTARRNSSPVVKIERSLDPEVPKSRPQPRPVIRQPKAEPSCSESVPAPQDGPSTFKTTKAVQDVATPAPSSKAKGKGRAVETDVLRQTASSPPAEERLHPDEQKELERAIEESRTMSPGSSPKAGESSRVGSTVSSMVPAPVTPSPSAGRVRMADLVASVTPVESTSTDSSPETVFVEDLTTSRRCTSLPDTCEVWDVALMDVILKSSYTGLPNLRAGHLVPWTDRAGKGNMRFSKWGEWCPEMNGRIAYDAMTFVKAANIQNPSRASPLDIVRRTVPQSANRYNFYVNTTPPLPLVATSCVFLDTSQLVSPSEKGLRQKYLIGNFHSFEWQRFCGFIRTASGYASLHAQLARDCLQFSTRAGRSQTPASDDNSNSPSPSGKRDTPADMFQVPSGRSSSSNRLAADTFSLPNDAIVPVYDARTFETLDFASVLPRLADTLPIYTGGELPYGAFVMVGYTVTIYRASSGNWTLGCNLQWAILIGSPHD